MTVLVGEFTLLTEASIHAAVAHIKRSAPPPFLRIMIERYGAPTRRNYRLALVKKDWHPPAGVEVHVI